MPDALRMQQMTIQNKKHKKKNRQSTSISNGLFNEWLFSIDKAVNTRQGISFSHWGGQ